MNQDSPEVLLAEGQICVLATVNPNGSAHAMPMWYLYENGEILFMTGPGSQKVKNVERNASATVVVDRREPPYYAVMVYGDAEVGAALDRGQKFRTVARYLGEDGAKNYLEKYHDNDTVSIHVRPRRMVEFSGSAGR